MNILYFAFANSTLPGQELPTLVEEEKNIRDILQQGVSDGEYQMERESFGNLHRISKHLQEFRDDLVWFHYSGHAEKNSLILGDEEARGEGIVHLLKQCPKLKGVVLNGCSTKWQAEQLIEAGIPLVIGTSSPVEDKKATYFSMGFYNMLSKKDAVNEAFDMAIGEVMGMGEVEFFRGGRPPKEEKAESTKWLLLHQDEDALTLKLPFGGELLEELKDRLTKLTTTDVGKTLDEMYALMDKESLRFNTVILLMGQYNQARRRELDGIARTGDTDIAYARVRNAVMSTLKDLEEEDLK
ncbi:MAG: hypothetical protein ACI9XO_000953 [Paraglaciecola sp.]|jgi:hypothetical protein